MNTLMLKEELPPTIEKCVLLKHIAWLWDLLEKQLNVDPFEGVSPHYRAQLTKQEESIISEMAHAIHIREILPVPPSTSSCADLRRS